MTACMRQADGYAMSEKKRFLRIELVDGRKAAADDYHHYLGLLGAGENAKPARTVEAIARLQADFKLIGIHEGRRLREEVCRDLERPCKSETSSEMPLSTICRIDRALSAR